MSSVLLDIAGHLEGLSEEQIARVEADIPSIRQLVAISQKARPLIEQAEPLLDQASKIWATIAPDAESVLATIQETKT